MSQVDNLTFAFYPSLTSYEKHTENHSKDNVVNLVPLHEFTQEEPAAQIVYSCYDEKGTSDFYAESSTGEKVDKLPDGIYTVLHRFRNLDLNIIKIGAEDMGGMHREYKAYPNPGETTWTPELSPKSANTGETWDSYIFIYNFEKSKELYHG